MLNKRTEEKRSFFFFLLLDPFVFLDHRHLQCAFAIEIQRIDHETRRERGKRHRDRGFRRDVWVFRPCWVISS